MIAAFIALLTLAGGAAPAVDDAEALFREGLKAYDAKAYTRAIEAFEAAHKLSPLPEILFDIAMARRALGDCRRAAEGFDAFIATAPADDPLLARARARRDELGACASASNEAGDGGDTAPSTPPAADGRSGIESRVVPLASPNPIAAQTRPALIATADTQQPAPRERPWLRNTCIGSLAGTALLGAGGFVFGWQALSARSDAENAPVWDYAAARAEERGRTYGQVATALFVSAGVTALVATASCVATVRSSARR